MAKTLDTLIGELAVTMGERDKAGRALKRARSVYSAAMEKVEDAQQAVDVALQEAVEGQRVGAKKKGKG